MLSFSLYYCDNIINGYAMLKFNEDSDILKFINGLSYLVSIIIPAFTMFKTILTFIEEDDTKYKIMENVKLFSKSVGITITWNVLYFSFVAVIATFITIFSKFDTSYVLITLCGVIFFITLVPFLIKTVKEKRYLIRIMENYKYKEKTIKNNSTAMEEIFSSISKSDIINELAEDNEKEQSYEDIRKKKQQIEQSKALNEEIKKVFKLNRSYDNLKLLSWVFYPTSTILATIFAGDFGNKEPSTPFIIVTFVLLILFNVMMVFRDLCIINGTAKIPSNILEEHIHSYDETINEQGKVYEQENEKDQTV